ncbi:MAG: hypothetical protein MRJ68_11730 [Nitrospira sp.]|nr:hypothetical protein [Nitrospira sp.]
MMAQVRAGQWTWRWMPVVMGLATVLLFGPALAQPPLAGKDVTIYVTDRGINQKEDWKKSGGQTLHWTMSDLNQKGRIAVIMPDDHEFQSLSTEALRQRIVQDLKAQVDRGISAGLSQFEIQLVQDINGAGYISFGLDDRQGMVDRFGAAAYGAIADLNAYLRDRGVNTTNRAIVGSNGAKVFAANVDAWQLKGQSIWESADFFDGRAYSTPMVEAIQKIGASRVRIFNTAGDLWAPFTEWGLRSIANRNTGRYLKDTHFPDLRVYELLVLKKDAAINHISGMTDSNVFRVSEYSNSAEGLQRIPGQFTGQALRNPLPPSVSRALPTGVNEGRAVWRPVVEELAGVLGWEKDKVANRLGNALMKDLEQAKDRDVVILSSHTFEELVKYTFEKLGESPLSRRPVTKQFFRRLDAYEEFFSGAMDMARTGKVDVDTMKRFDAGVIELVKQEWRDKSPQLQAARRMVRHGERQVHAAEQALRDVQRQLHRWADKPAMLQRQEAKVRRLTTQLEQHQAKLAMAKQAERSLINRLLLLDAIPVFAAAMAEHAREGHVTVNVVDRLSDGVIMLSATVIATSVERVPILAPFVPEVRDGIVVLATATRDHLAQETVRKTEERFRILDDYQTYQARAVQDRQVLKTWSEIYGHDSLRKLGYTDRQIAEQDEQAMRLNLARGLGATPSHTATSAGATGTLPDAPLSARGPCGGGNQSCPPPSATLAPPPAPGRPGPPPPPPSPTVPEDKTPLGGIDLTIQGVVVDRTSGTIAVLTENGSESGAGIAARDLAFALWLTYSGHQAAFSLDPADPNDPSGKWLKAVYYPEALRATRAGLDLFEADFLLKQYAFGVRVEGNQIVQRHTATALKSIPQMMEQSEKTEGRDNESQWARMWIVVPRVDLQVTDGIATIARVQMAVRARRQVPDPSSPTGLRDVDTDDRSVEAQFARQFSTLYNELGRVEAPPLLRVRELAKAIAYAQWMKRQNIPVDMKQVIAVLNQDHVDAIDKITALSVDWRTQAQQRVPVPGGIQVRTLTKTIHIFGGVDLAVKPKITEDRAAGTLRQAVLSKLTLARSNTPVVIKHDGHHYQAFVMPFRVAR